MQKPIQVHPEKFATIRDFAVTVRETFRLNVSPWSGMWDDLVYLAFTPECDRLSSKLKPIFGTCNHQTLEFYGDTVLYTVVGIILLDKFQLKESPGPHILTRIKSYLTQNRTLTDIMLNKDACKFVRGRTFTIAETKRFHNRCADSFEALLGAMFYHLHYVYKKPWVIPITEWLTANTEIPNLLENFLAVTVLTPKKPSVSPKVVVSPETPIEEIYAKLGWKYAAPLKLNGDFNLVGYPQDETKIIGTGVDATAAILDGKGYLLQNGFIVYQQEVPKFFRK